MLAQRRHGQIANRHRPETHEQPSRKQVPAEASAVRCQTEHQAIEAAAEAQGPQSAAYRRMLQICRTHQQPSAAEPYPTLQALRVLLVEEADRLGRQHLAETG